MKTSARRGPMYLSEQVSKHRWRRSESTSVHDNRHQEARRKQRRTTTTELHDVAVAQATSSKAMV